MCFLPFIKSDGKVLSVNMKNDNMNVVFMAISQSKILNIWNWILDGLILDLLQYIIS